MKIIKSAVCLIIESTSGRYFAVSRRNDTTQWGFPGGKVDPGESHDEAIIRETWEEIGFNVKKDKIVPIYSGLCRGKDGNDFWVTTYLYSELMDEEELVTKIALEEGLTGAFASGDDLISAQFSPFNFYNDEALTAVDKYRGFY